MIVGVSPSALQEMQLLNQLHFAIPGPQGHPNFSLPIAIAVDSNDIKQELNEVVEEEPNLTEFMSAHSDNILSIPQTLIKNKETVEKNIKKHSITGSHLVFQSTPIALQKVLDINKKGNIGNSEPVPVSHPILMAWFHDMLSIIVHCHANHVILRTLHPDRIMVDQSGVLKIRCLSRSIVIHPDDRDKFLDPYRSWKTNKKRDCGVTDDDILGNPYMAPELLLGSIRYTQESDMWALGCMISHILLNKQIFSGRDRYSKMRAIFKIVGTPSTSNYKKAETYPFFSKCKLATTGNSEKRFKKYSKGVGKALKFMLKSSDVDTTEYSGIFELLEKILDLDPQKRISAADALIDPYMIKYTEKIKSDEFKKQFVNDWTTLKSKIWSLPKDESQNSSNKRKTIFSMETNPDDEVLYDSDKGITRIKREGKRIKTE